MKLFRRLSFLALAAGVIGYSAPAKAMVSIANFQIGGIAAFTGGGGSEVFVQGAWTPYVSLGVVGLRGDFGVTAFKNALGNRFMVTNYEGLLSLSLAPMVSLDLGGGVHTWHSNGGSAGAFTANLVIGMAAGIDRIYVGYTRFTLGTGVNLVRAGIGFSF